MDIKSRFSEKLSNILFLEVKREKLNAIFKTDIKEDIYLPVKSSNLVDGVKEQSSLDKIPLSFFIEGMYFVMGADENFKFNMHYKKILINIKDSIQFIKGIIAENVKNENYEDSYILLKGLSNIENTNEIYDKLIMILDGLRAKDKIYKEEELEIIEKAKENEDNPIPYLYEAFIRREEKDYEKALFCINNYLSRGGKETLEITELKDSLKLSVDYENAKEILYDEPQEALKIFLPMLNEFGDDPAIYYYIAVAYRILENYEKAIYYLNESLNIDSNIIEVVNELGINYASIEDYKTAIAYLRKAFEATRSVEICTNLIMCYINCGEINNAKTHLEIAKKLDPNDEIVIQLENILNK